MSANIIYRIFLQNQDPIKKIYTLSKNGRPSGAIIEINIEIRRRICHEPSKRSLYPAECHHTRLRDFYSSLEECCKAESTDPAAIRENWHLSGTSIPPTKTSLSINNIKKALTAFYSRQSLSFYSFDYACPARAFFKQTVDSLNRVQQRADRLVMIQVIDDICDVFRHINLAIPFTFEQFRAAVDQIGRKYSGDVALFVGSVEFSRPSQTDQRWCR